MKRALFLLTVATALLGCGASSPLAEEADPGPPLPPGSRARIIMEGHEDRWLDIFVTDVTAPSKSACDTILNDQVRVLSRASAGAAWTVQPCSDAPMSARKPGQGTRALLVDPRPVNDVELLLSAVTQGESAEFVTEATATVTAYTGFATMAECQKLLADLAAFHERADADGHARVRAFLQEQIAQQTQRRDASCATTTTCEDAEVVKAAVAKRCGTPAAEKSKQCALAQERAQTLSQCLMEAERTDHACQTDEQLLGLITARLAEPAKPAPFTASCQPVTR